MLEVFKMGYRIHSLNQALSYFAHTWDLSIFFAMCFGGSKLFQSSLSFFQGLFFFCSPTFETIFVILLKWTTIGNDFRTNFQKTFLLSPLRLPSLLIPRFSKPFLSLMILSLPHSCSGSIKRLKFTFLTPTLARWLRLCLFAPLHLLAAIFISKDTLLPFCLSQRLHFFSPAKKLPLAISRIFPPRT